MTKKKIIIIASAVIGLLVLLLVVLWIMSLISHKYYTYEQVEAKIVEATNNFYKQNPEILPVNDGKSTLSYNTLVEKGFIKPLNELLKDGDSCSAEIYVIKNQNDYNYYPKLTCSDKYETLDLATHILRNHEVVTEGSGLYSDGDGGYYFKGKIEDNYVFLGSYKPQYSKDTVKLLWHIISIDKNNVIRMRSLHNSGNSVYDSRYNEEQKGKTGYNDFENSILKDKLLELSNDESILTKKEKSLLVKKPLCIAPRKNTDKSKDGSTECSVMSQDEYLFGLMYPYEFLRGSLDENCIDMTSYSCQNFNLLSGSGFNENWTVTSDPETNYQAYSFDGVVYYYTKANNNRALYLTTHLNPYVTFKSGDGTRDNPYVLLNEK